MRRNIYAVLALILWGAGLTAAAVAQQPVKQSHLNDRQKQKPRHEAGACDAVPYIRP
jgi:hypothetical protein